LDHAEHGEIIGRSGREDLVSSADGVRSAMASRFASIALLLD
jgi:hypothetical protein